MIYVSGALHSAAQLDSAREFYVWIGDVVLETGRRPYIPHLVTDPEDFGEMTAIDVHRIDMTAISKAVGIIASLNEPSHGVGAEVAIALQRQIPVLAILEQERSCSRFLEGLLDGSGQPVLRYENLDYLRLKIKDFISTLPTYG